jgi:NADPH:quinone reductase-like Zn-dependent oxidoreductase
MHAMRAVRAHRRGGPEQLVYEVAPRPEPAPGEVLVAVHAASMTPNELTWDTTWTDNLKRDRTPIIPSHEMSGVVAERGRARPSARPIVPVGAPVTFVVAGRRALSAPVRTRGPDRCIQRVRLSCCPARVVLTPRQGD